MDEFFKVVNCKRCFKALTLRTMSHMNNDTICVECNQEEKKHPNYKEACDKEAEEINKGNLNYAGLYAGQTYPFKK